MGSSSANKCKKLEAGADYYGPFSGPIEINVSGIRINHAASLPTPHDTEMFVLPRESDQSIKRGGTLKEIMPSV